MRPTEEDEQATGFSPDGANLLTVTLDRGRGEAGQIGERQAVGRITEPGRGSFHPEPSTIATSWRSTPVTSRRRSAASLASSIGSECARDMRE